MEPGDRGPSCGSGGDATALGFAAAGTSACAAGFWRAHRHPVQHATAYASVLLLAGSLAALSPGPETLPGLAIWTVGVAWALSGTAGLIRPAPLARWLGGARCRRRCAGGGRHRLGVGARPGHRRRARRCVDPATGHGAAGHLRRGGASHRADGGGAVVPRCVERGVGAAAGRTGAGWRAAPPVGFGMPAEAVLTRFGGRHQPTLGAGGRRVWDQCSRVAAAVRVPVT